MKPDEKLLAIVKRLIGEMEGELFRKCYRLLKIGLYTGTIHQCLRNGLANEELTEGMMDAILDYDEAAFRGFAKVLIDDPEFNDVIEREYRQSQIGWLFARKIKWGGESWRILFH